MKYLCKTHAAFLKARNAQHKAELSCYYLTCVRRSMPSAASLANFATLQSTGEYKAALKQLLTSYGVR